MLKIENLNTIKGKQITDKLEVYSVEERADDYVFMISNVGIYKHINWYFFLQRKQADGAMGAYKLISNNNGTIYSHFLSIDEITPAGIMQGFYKIMDDIKKDLK